MIEVMFEVMRYLSTVYVFLLVSSQYNVNDSIKR